MTTIWFLIYNTIIIPVLYLFFRAGSLFNKKIKEGFQDRKGLFKKLENDISTLDGSKKIIWFHSASMGEFEQAKPIIEKLKSEHDVNILVTFFSPSGYRNSLKYKYKDVISYLPFDSTRQVRKFIEIVNPDLMVFMRYDFWPNLVRELHRKKIPSFLVDATMREDSKRNLPVSRSFHKILFPMFERILTVSPEDLKNFKMYNISDDKMSAVGDTRFDRVYTKYKHAKELKLIEEELFTGKKVVVLGSSWPSDEEVVLPALKNLMMADENLKIILVPHEPTIDRLEKIEENLNGKISNIRFSHLNKYNNEQIIIVDSIGILVSLYYYADLAYIGGSFKQGVHNVLEAAVYGIPVLFGPRITNSQEALKLINLGCGTVLINASEAQEKFKELLYNDSLRKKTGDVAYNYVNGNIGATDKIVNELAKYI